MVAPTQRDAPRIQLGWDPNEKAKDATRKQEFEEMKEAHLLKAQKMEQKKQRERRQAKERWSRERNSRRLAEDREKQSCLSARRRLFAELPHARRDEQEMSEAMTRQVGDVELQMSRLWGERDQERLQSIRSQVKAEARCYDQRMETRLLLKAIAEAEEAEERAQQRAVTAARKAEIVADKQQAAVREVRKNEWQQANMAYDTEQQAARERARYKMRRARGEMMRDANVDYLNTDTRVTRWHAICWHDPKDETDWRWPFSLDWSWIMRGAHILEVRNERFAGLTLPAGFVKPSERIMSARQKEKHPERERVSV